MARHRGKSAVGRRGPKARDNASSSSLSNAAVHLTNDRSPILNRKNNSKQTARAIPISSAGESEDAGGASSASEGDDEDDEADEEEEDAEEPESFAPSVLSRRKRGHQTGLSLTLTKTAIGSGARIGSNGGSGNKRRREGGSAQPEENKPYPSKAQKVSQCPPSPESSDGDDAYEGVDLISESGDEDQIMNEETDEIIRDMDDNLVGQRHGGFFENEFDVYDSEYVGETYTTPGMMSDQLLSPADFSPERHVPFDDIVLPQLDYGRQLDDLSTPTNPFVEQGSLDEKLRRRLKASHTEPGSRGLAGGAGVDHIDRVGRGRSRSDPLKYRRQNIDSDDAFTGDQSDQGATTDEEVMKPVTVNHPETQLSLNSDSSRPGTASRQVPTSCRPSDVENPALRTQKPVAKPIMKPIMNLWTPDRHKVHAYVDKKGKQVVIDPRRRQRKARLRHSARNVAQASKMSIPGPVLCELISDILLPGPDTNPENANLFSSLIQPPFTLSDGEDESVDWEDFVQVTGNNLGLDLQPDDGTTDTILGSNSAGIVVGSVE